MYKESYIMIVNIFNRGGYYGRILEKSDIEYQVVTVRFPKEIYQEYKKILKSEGKIPTYDLRNYIFSVVEEYEKGQR